MAKIQESGLVVKGKTTNHGGLKPPAIPRPKGPPPAMSPTSTTKPSPKNS